jgi:hypothetical protein
LGGDQRIEEFPAALNHGVDLATAAAEMLVIVKGLPQIINRFMTWFGAGINEDTDFRLSTRIKWSQGSTSEKTIPSASVQ